MSANPAAAFLASMARPDAGAVAQAVAETAPDTTARALTDAIEDVRAESLAPQRPPRTPPPGGVDPELLENSSTPIDLGFSDGPAEPTAVNHRVDPRFQLADEPEPEPAPLPAPRPAAWERAAAAAAAAPEPGYLPPPPEPDPEPEPAGSSRRERLRGISTRPPHRRVKIGVVSACAVLLVVVIASSIVASGSGEPPVPAGQVAAPPAANDVPAAATSKDAPLVPATVSASCGNDSDGVAPFANDRTRAWVCKRISGLDLNVLNISFACPVVITSITVVPGWSFVAPDGRDEWVRHRLVTGISWRMGGGIYPMAIVPTRTGVTLRLPGTGVITQEMSATITSSMRPPMGESATDDFGSKADDAAKVDEHTAIGRIVINGYPVDPGSGMCGSQTAATR